MAQYYIFSVREMEYVANGGTAQGLTGTGSALPVATYQGEAACLNYFLNELGLTIVWVSGYGPMREYIFSA